MARIFDEMIVSNAKVTRSMLNEVELAILLNNYLNEEIYLEQSIAQLHERYQYVLERLAAFGAVWMFSARNTSTSGWPPVPYINQRQ